MTFNANSMNKDAKSLTVGPYSSETHGVEDLSIMTILAKVTLKDESKLMFVFRCSVCVCVKC